MCKNLNVFYNGIEYYGGHQEWLKSYGVSSFFRNRACGLAAISNVIYYYTKDEYCEILKTAFNILKPTLFGIYSAKRLKNTLDELANVYDLDIISEIFNPYTYAGFKWYVNYIIKTGGFVIMLNYNNKNKELSYHWVTITGVNDKEIITSNWGNKMSYKFSDVWNSKGVMLKLIGIKKASN